MYCAIIGDIVKSREIQERRELQHKLEAVLHEINENYADFITAKFTITLGDEFQGLLVSPEKSFEIIDYIKVKLRPIKFRFGIGIGGMSTDIKVIAIGSDGPAYHVARDALNNVKDSNIKYSQAERDMLVYGISINSNMYEKFELINALLSTCYFIEKKWSDKQIEIIKHLMNSDYSHRELATIYQISQPSITRRIENSGYYTYKEAKAVANKYLMEKWEKMNG